jgi:hypothetical protein
LVEVHATKRVNTMSESDSPRPDETTTELFARVTDRLSRRRMMGDVAKAGIGVMALGGLGAGSAAAHGQGNGNGKGKGGDKGQGAKGEDALSVADIVNFALSLERLEATYYERALASSGGAFDERDIECGEISAAFGVPTLRDSTYQALEDVRDHEQFHVEALEDVLDTIGAEDRAATEFEFPDGVYDDPANFAKFATVLEDTGVAAYAGAAPALAKAELALVNGDVSELRVTPAALGIHSIEARHASYLRTLDRRRPWTVGEDVTLAEQAIDDPKTMDEVLAVAGEYIVE